MIECPTVQKSAIRFHYDLSTVFYRLLWGEHIHHGLWEGEESSRVAQRQLTKRLAEAAGISQGARVLDVGCGMGGSSIYLARELDCRVTGVTLSPVQRQWARWSSRINRVGRRTDFICEDAERMILPSETFDTIWSVECTEHLFDKPAFFSRAATWLLPNGRMAICAWLAGDDLRDREAQKQVFDVCEGFFCPSLGSRADYTNWFNAAGLEVTQFHDWTKRVIRTWEICAERVARYRIKKLARWCGRDALLFLNRFDTILNAYRSGAMQYGCFIARRESRST